MQIILDIIVVLFLIILCEFILAHFLRLARCKAKPKLILKRISLREINNKLNSTELTVQKGNKMSKFNLYPGFELFGTYQCKDKGEARKGENFTSENFPEHAVATFENPRDYTDEQGNVGTEVDVIIGFVGEGDHPLKLKFDALEGELVSEVTEEIEINCTTLATSGSFTPILRPATTQL